MLALLGSVRYDPSYFHVLLCFCSICVLWYCNILVLLFYNLQLFVYLQLRNTLTYLLNYLQTSCYGISRILEAMVRMSDLQSRGGGF